MEFQKNDILTVEIIDMGTEGEGIGKVDGYTLFVKDAVIGDVIEAKLMKLKKNYGYARLEKIIKPSPKRVEPRCSFHRRCGGCTLQTLDYQEQLQFKQSKIRGNLIRIGGFSPEKIDEIMEPIVGMEQPYRYRNKAQYPVGADKQGQPITGFYAERSHDIIANTDCLLGVEENKDILEIILQHMKEYHIPAYQEESGKGLVRHILIRKGFTSGEIMVCLVLNAKKKNEGRAAECERSTNGKSGNEEVSGAWSDSGKSGNEEVSGTWSTSGKNGNEEVSGALSSRKLDKQEYFHKQELLLEKLAGIQGMTSISISLNSEKTNVIMGKEIITLWGRDTIQDTIHVRDIKNFTRTGEGIVFSISPLSFYQVNPVQTEKLYSLALDYADLTGQETVWDLYCGIGTISLFLAGRAKQVYGVEIIPQAIEDARSNAANNQISNAEFFVGKAEEVLPEKYENEGIHADVIVVDPPRKGCDTACLETMLKMKPERIVYVSCDSATLARDLKILCEGGYKLVKARGVDQFGQTGHTECAVLLTRQKG